MRKSLTTAMACFLLTNCSFLPEPSEAPDRFILSTLPEQKQRKTLNPGIIIDQPVVSAPLDNARVAIRPTEHRIDYIADIEWGDRLGTLIHESLIQSLQNAQAFDAVGRLNSGMQAPYLVSIDVRKFYELCFAKKVEAEYFVQVSHMNERTVFASRLFHTQIPCDTHHASAVPLALDRANQKLMKEIKDWLIEITAR